MSDEQLPRGLELASDEALQGLCPNEWAEFDAVFPQRAEREQLLVELEALVAEIAIAESDAEKMPAHLHARLLSTCDLVVAPPAGRASARVVPLRPRKTKLPELARSAGWLVAAAAALAFWFERQSNDAERPAPQEVAQPAAPVVKEPLPTEPVPAQEREALLKHAATRQVEWTVTSDPTARGASGDLVWNGSNGQGFMRFHGLSPNDPSQLSYQLWIFDAERDDAHPVDGGVFDVKTPGEVVVKIDPRIPIHRAKLFAVTVERPGGVVVSKRERIVVTAAIPPT